MNTENALKPKLRAMLERIRDQSGTLQALQITANGPSERRRLEQLIVMDYAEIVSHPTVKSGSRPAAAIAITERGRAALAE